MLRQGRFNPVKLRYAPPVQSGVVTVDLKSSPGDYFATWEAGKDYVVELSPTVARTGKLEINANGANSVKIVGGFWVPTTDDEYMVHIHNLAGWGFFEGLEATGKEGVHRDFLDISGGSLYTPTVYAQNCRYANLTADNSTHHADFFQPQGKVGYVYCDKITVSSNYDGYTIASDGSTGGVPAKGVVLSRHNMWYSAVNEVNTETAFFWINNGGRGAADTLPFPLSFDRMYVDIVRGYGRPAYATHFCSVCFPKVSGGGDTGAKGQEGSAFEPLEAIGATDNAEHTACSFTNPKMLVSGEIKRGSPPINGKDVQEDSDGLGSFACAGIGKNYVSPGYL